MIDEARQLGDVSVVRYILLRLILCAGLFGLAAAVVLSQPWVMFTMSTLFNVAAVVFLVMALSAAGVRRHGDKAWFRWSQLLFDTVLVTTLVWLSDGPKSPFFVLYFMNIVADLLRMNELAWHATITILRIAGEDEDEDSNTSQDATRIHTAKASRIHQNANPNKA